MNGTRRRSGTAAAGRGRRRAALVPAPRVERGLTAADFSPIAVAGFGDGENSYAHSMAWFRDRVYVGTLRNALPLLKLFPPPSPPVLEPWPVRPSASVEELNLRAQIWRWDVKGGTWERTYVSPVVPGRTGGKAPRDIGYRGMVVFQGTSDAAAALYVSTISTVRRGTAALILRSEDGEHFDVVGEPGLGNPQVSTFRSLVVFDDHLFAAPAGEGTTWNTMRAPVILRSADPRSGRWSVASPPGFGDPSNHGIFELAVFDDHLYASTFNYYEGCQIWKTPATGRGACQWTKVLERGAYRGSLNEMILGMCAFEGALYAGTGIQNGGFDRWNGVGPAAGELIRIFPDDTWELIVGAPRDTPAGQVYPRSGMGPGFDNHFSGYIWRLAVHAGWLYATTFDWSMFLAYARRPPQRVRKMMRYFGVDHMIQTGSGFQLWRTRDGAHWIPVTTNGFGNAYNHGGRTLLSTPSGMFVGTANPFGPEVAARLSTGWTYVGNPRGGAEVWWAPFAGNEDAGERPAVAAATAVANELSGAAVRPAAPHRARRTARPAIALVTGAAGFIGAHLVDWLLERGDAVRILAPEWATPDLPFSADAEVVCGDCADAASLASALRHVTVVYHLEELGVGYSLPDVMKANADATANLLRACVTSSAVRRVVVSSSVAVYEGAFDADAWPLTEQHAVRPQGPRRGRGYALSKLAAEEATRRCHDEHGLQYAIVRRGPVYGPGDRRFEAWIAETVSGDSGRRDSNRALQLSHVRDVAAVYGLAGHHTAASNETFNAAALETTTFRAMAAVVRRLAGRASASERLPDRDALWRRYLLAYDVSKAQRLLGFNPRVPLAEGLADMVSLASRSRRARSAGRATTDRRLRPCEPY